MAYDNLLRPGMRTTTTVNPRVVLQDIDEEIRRLDPESTPLLTIASLLSKGKSPKSKKFQNMQYDSTDHYDTASQFALGTGTFSRFAVFRVDQRSRPTTQSQMIYNVQDTFYIPETGQNVEVMVTPSASTPIDTAGATFAVPAAQTTLIRNGGTGTRTAGMDIIVRNVEPFPLLTPPANFTIIWKGRTIYESQDVQASPVQRDLIFDFNYVEHKERVVECTEDQKNFIQTLGKKPDWSFQQEETWKDLKKDVEYTLLFGERAADYTIAGRPKYYTRGIVPSIQDNVTFYNPFSTVDFEKLFIRFINRQAFRYNPNGNSKMMLMGRALHENFALAFRDYRRLNDDNAKNLNVGLSISTYEFQGFKLKIVPTDHFRLGTPMEHWGLVVDPLEMKLRVADGKDFHTFEYQAPGQRTYKLANEWQGGIALNRTECHAFLRTA